MREESKMVENDRRIILEGGSFFDGTGFGAEVDRVCEVVFNTSVVGYQEILSDPSYAYQAVVMTYPLIGNYGMADDDYEAQRPAAGALIVRDYCDEPSNFRSAETLSTVMRRFGIPGIAGIDTRTLTRSIRDGGSRRALITKASTSIEEGLAIIAATPVPTDAVSFASRREPHVYRTAHERHHVVAIDCGMKANIVRSLSERGCRVSAVPWNTRAEDIMRLKPDGVLVSNGPGDPADVPEVAATVRGLVGTVPMFGICLGHQIIARAYGARTYKLKFGHRGGNHPVRNLLTGRVEITSQNHSYAVDGKSLAATPLSVTHVNVLDGTVEGLSCERDRVMSVQYHPESAPGPQDSAYLFDEFVAMMEGARHA
ncbi:MAG: glutamine-hydrolyzing carbamoyl-phosphate synthase small subunit [Eggerthellaceae bacterium]|nr:glutamine-hydrolyzing carbamoyl-phosphate synthase small subunit [Eggerthellaceae bacterium]